MASANFSNPRQESAGLSNIIVKALLAKSTATGGGIIYTLLLLGMRRFYSIRAFIWLFRRYHWC